MKPNPTLRATIALLLITSVFLSCQKTELERNQTAASTEKITNVAGFNKGNGRTAAAGVVLIAPTTVNINESFTILAEIDCGRVSLERGYTLNPDNSRNYTNLDCGSANMQWEMVVNYQCYTSDLTWNSSFTEAGTYVYRTRHNANDANCDGLGGGNTSGNCSFSGSQVYCFTIVAEEPASTSFTGNAIICSTVREVVYTFQPSSDENYVKLQGVLNYCTNTNAQVTVSGAALTVTQTASGVATVRNVKLEGSVAANQMVTVTIRWNACATGGTSTGEWTAKNAAGMDLAAPIPGLNCWEEKSSN